VCIGEKQQDRALPPRPPRPPRPPLPCSVSFEEEKEEEGARRVDFFLTWVVGGAFQIHFIRCARYYLSCGREGNAFRRGGGSAKKD